MPTPFMHLHTAEQMRTAVQAQAGNGRLAELLQAQWPAFYFGSVAPDFQGIVGLPRAQSHFFEMPPLPGHDAMQQMLHTYPQLANPAALPPGQAVFVAAYGAHLLLDLIWFYDVVMALFRQPSLGARDHRILLHFALLTWLDRQAYEALPSTAAQTLAAAVPDGWLPFADAAVLASWRDLIVTQLRPGDRIQTIDIFAERIGMTPTAFAAMIEDDTWIQQELFAVIPLDQVQHALATAVPRSIDLLTRYLLPSH